MSAKKKSNSANSKPSSKKGATSKKNKKNRLGLKIAAVAVVWVLLACSVLFFESSINNALGFVQKEGEVSTSERPISAALAHQSQSSLTIHHIDVGQGDATLIELPTSDSKPKLMLIDGAPRKSRDLLTNYIDAAFPQLLNSDYYLEYVILTHADEDHCGALDIAITRYGAKTIYRPNVRSTASGYSDPAVGLSGRGALVGAGKSGNGTKDTQAYKRFLEASYASTVSGSEVIVNINPKTASDNAQKYIDIYDGNNDGDYNDFEDCRLTFFTPLSDYYKDGNDYSPIMTLDYLGKRALFTGDAEKTAEAEFVAQYTKAEFGKSADIVKLGHHGSRTSSSEALLTMVTASNRSSTYAVISCGVGNSYGHPHDEVMERISSMGFMQRNIVRTDLDSNIVFVIYLQGSEGAIALGTGLHREIDEPIMRWAYIAAFLAVVTVVVIFGLDYKKIKKSLKKYTS